MDLKWDFEIYLIVIVLFVLVSIEKNKGLLLYGNFVSLNVLIYGFIWYNGDVVGIMKMFLNFMVEFKNLE